MGLTPGVWSGLDDRLLVAQAVAEPLQRLTADAPLVQYSELVLVA